MNPVLINGKNYDWSDLTWIILGIPLAGITEINYSRKRMRKNNYGAGNEPVGYGLGNFEYSGDITVFTEVVNQILETAPGRSILEIPPFSATNMFSGDGVAFTTHILNNITFVEDNFSAKQGDTALYSKLPFIYAGLKK